MSPSLVADAIMYELIFFFYFIEEGEGKSYEIDQKLNFKTLIIQNMVFVNLLSACGVYCIY